MAAADGMNDTSLSISLAPKYARIMLQVGLWEAFSDLDLE